MPTTFLVISIDGLGEGGMSIKEIEANTKDEAIEKSGFPLAVAFISRTSQTTNDQKNLTHVDKSHFEKV
jgi:hypothetical protein